MHVLLICDAYPPEVRSASVLTFDFATALKERGHAVTVLTGYPRYNLAEDASQYPEDSVEAGIRVLRVRTAPIKMVHPVRRGLAELTLPSRFASAMRAVREPVDVIEVYSPPLPLALAGWRLKRRYRCPMVLNVQDLFPQNALDLGIVRRGPVYAGLLALERLAYRCADAITVHSSGNRDFLISRRGQDSDHVHVISNWVDPSQFATSGAAALTGGSYRRRWGLERRFALLFAGVLGPAQGLDTVIDAAWQARDVEDLVVLLVGDGTEKNRLIERCQARGQTNVRFEHFVSKDEYPKLLAECDVGLVSLAGSYHTPVVPGKLLGYMAAGVPALAALNGESDGHIILAESGAGISVPAGDAAALAAAMRRLSAWTAGLSAIQGKTIVSEVRTGYRTICPLCGSTTTEGDSHGSAVRTRKSHSAALKKPRMQRTAGRSLSTSAAGRSVGSPEGESDIVLIRSNSARMPGSAAPSASSRRSACGQSCGPPVPFPAKAI